jgi:hypothetical protein
LDEAALSRLRKRWGLTEEKQDHHVASQRRESSSPESLPSILISDRPLRDVAADALAALESANDPPRLFVRAGKPCRVRQDENGRPLIERVTDSELKHRMERTANFIVATKGGYKHVSAPMDLVKDLMAHESWPFPGLVGIAEVPVIRPDGTILEEAGYDPTTKLIYFPNPGLRFPSVSPSPRSDQIDWAREMIEEMIGDFPFANAASKTNAIAALLTPIVRPLIPGQTPLGLLDAPMPGTGKGLFAECVGLVATGRSAALMTAPDTEDEWRKRITAALLEGATMITIDNLEGKLESPSVASVLTSPSWSDRILGVTKNAVLPQRASWLATGNNIVLGGDLPRRCYLIRIDARTSKPWERAGWRHPELRQWVADHRGELIGALLMLVRYWYSRGRPDYLVPRLGGFESWCGTVGNVLFHAGYTDFLANQKDLYDNNDSDGGQWEAFFEAWDSVFRDHPITVSEVIRELTTNHDLRDAVPDWLADSYHRDPAKFRQQLGMALRRQRGAQFGLWRLEGAGVNRRKVAQWKVVQISEANDKAA